MTDKMEVDGSNFNDRMNAILSSIDSVSVDLTSQPTNSLKRRNSPDKEIDGNDGFKIPDVPPPKHSPIKFNSKRHQYTPHTRSNKTPDFVKNPQKWTKYNLEDTPEMNDKNNKVIAMSILQDLESQKNQNPDLDTCTVDSTTDKIIFKKPVPNVNNSNTDETTSEITSEITSETTSETKKHTSKKDEKKPNKSKGNAASVMLTHLDYEEEEDQES